MAGETETCLVIASHWQLFAAYCGTKQRDLMSKLTCFGISVWFFDNWTMQLNYPLPFPKY